MAFWVVMPCNPVGAYQHFRLLSFWTFICCLLQERNVF